MPDEQADAATVTVTVFADGGTQLALSPVAGGAELAVLERAAAAIEDARRSFERDREPVVCPLCGTLATAATAGADGATVLSPCGHAVG